MKKHICRLIVFILLISLSGCVQTSEDKEKETLVYYKEENIVLPDGIGNIFDIEETKDGSIHIITNAKKGSGQILELEKNANSWRKSSAEWKGLGDSVLFDASFLEKDKCYTSVLYNALLAKSEKAAQKLHPKYFVIDSDGLTKELKLDISEGDKLTEDNLFQGFIQTEDALIGMDNAGIVYSFSWEGEIIYKNAEVRNQATGIVTMLHVDDILYVVLENKKVYCMEANTGVAVEGDKRLKKYLALTKGEYSAYVDATTNKIYKLNDGKLSSYDLDENKSKKLLDLKYFNLQNGQNFQILPTKNGSIYIAYTTSTGEVKLSRLQYVKKGVKATRGTIKLYALRDIDVQSLVDAFHKKYPEIGLEIEYGCTGDNGRTEADAIKQLNTELLAGKGPDILILDDLPVQTYYEQGLLEDLSNVVDIKAMKEKMYKNMLEPYSAHGVQYAIPAAFKIYGIVGEEECVDKFDNTDEFLDLLESKNMKFAFPDDSLSDIAHVFYTQNASGLFTQKAELDSEKLGQFYLNMSRLYKLSGNSFGEDNKDWSIRSNWGYSNMAGCVGSIYYDKLPSAVAQYQDRDAFTAAKYLIEKKGYAQKYVYNNGKLVYKDDLVLGVSRSSVKKNEIKAFLELILNPEDPKDPDNPIVNGMLKLPSNKEVLKNALLSNHGQTEYMISQFSYEEEPSEKDMYTINGLSLTEKEIAALDKELSQAVYVPHIEEEKMIMEGGSAYCIGEKTLKQAVNETVKKVSIYNKE